MPSMHVLSLGIPEPVSGMGMHILATAMALVPVSFPNGKRENLFAVYWYCMHGSAMARTGSVYLFAALTWPMTR